MPTEDGDGTDYGVTVYGWENGVIGYHYGTSILNYNNIGEIYILIFGADCYGSDLENYEYLTVKTASEVIKYNTQKIMDIITTMSKEEIETEEN